MRLCRTLLSVGMLINVVDAAPASPAIAQTVAAKNAQPIGAGFRKLTGDDAKRAGELDKSIDAALTADRLEGAIAGAQELVALRERKLGKRNFETVNAEWRLEALRRVAKVPENDRAAYRSVKATDAQAEALYNRRKYAEAQALLEKSLEIRRHVLTDHHPDTANVYMSLAATLSSQGKYAQAQPLHEKAREIFGRLLTKDHPQTAKSDEWVASNLDAQGKYTQAEPVHEEAVEITRRLFGENDSRTAKCYNNMALNLNAQAKYSQAQPMFERALTITRRILTDDHRDTAAGYNNLALNLDDQGKHAQAQPLYEKALEITRRLLSEYHPQTAGSYNNVAHNLNMQGKYAQAQPMYEKALEIRLHLLGDKHVDTAQSYDNLAANLRAQRKYAEARLLYEKALEIQRLVLTDDHPHTALSYNNLARVFNAQGNYIPAELLFEKALGIRRRILTDLHPETASSYRGLAGSLNAQGQYARAQPLYEKAVTICRRILPEDHRDTAQSYGDLARNLNAQGKYAEARDQWLLAAKSLESARRGIAFLGLDRSGAQSSARPALGAVLARLGQQADAWQVLEEDLGRGLLDGLAARQDERLTPDERRRLRELTTALEQLDRLVETTPRDLDQTERTKRFEDFKRKRELASIALGEFQGKVVKDHGDISGRVGTLSEIQAALPADAALVAWVDIPPAGPNAADPDGERWGVVVRSRGVPAWIPITGTGRNGLWTTDDIALAGRVRTELRNTPRAGSPDRELIFEKLRAQRLDPLRKALDATNRRLIVLLSRRAVAQGRGTA